MVEGFIGERYFVVSDEHAVIQMYFNMRDAVGSDPLVIDVFDESGLFVESWKRVGHGEYKARYIGFEGNEILGEQRLRLR
jgi:hypothetical protein